VKRKHTDEGKILATFLSRSQLNEKREESVSSIMSSCFFCPSPAEKECLECGGRVKYCSEKHYKLHRIEYGGERICLPFKVVNTQHKVGGKEQNMHLACRTRN